MMNLRAMKESRTIEVKILGKSGTVSTHTISSKKEKLKMIWLMLESAPPHLAAATMIDTMVSNINGIKR